MKKLTQEHFQERRDILAGEMGLRSIAIIATSPVAMRNNDADYKYRADSSFFYLTGFAEPEAVAVIETFDTEEEGYCYSLFCRERNREMEIWNGYRAGIDGAIENYEADEAFAIESLDILPRPVGIGYTYEQAGSKFFGFNGEEFDNNYGFGIGRFIDA